MANAKFDRSQFKGTDLKTIKQQNNEISSGGFKKRDYVDIKEGVNKFRFLPAHPESDKDNRYAQEKWVSWLPYYKKDEEGNVTKTLANRPFLNARVHAKQKLDIVEEFIATAAQVISSSSLSTKEKKTKLDGLSDFQKGIKPQGKFVAYALKLDSSAKNVESKGLIELSYGIKKKLDAISLAEYEEDPSGADIISCIDEGVVITIKYDKTKPNNEKYSVNQGRKALPIDEEQLEWFSEEDSLTEILHNSVVYNKGTLERAMESLKVYDKLNELDVFDSEEFQSAAKSIKAVLPDAPVRDDEGEDEEDSSDFKSKKLGDMSRAELKEFINEEDLDIRVLKKTEIETVLEMIETETGLTADDYADLSKADSDSDDEDDEDEVFEDDDVENDASKEEDDEEEEEEEKPRSRRSRRTRG